MTKLSVFFSGIIMLILMTNTSCQVSSNTMYDSFNIPKVIRDSLPEESPCFEQVFANTSPVFNKYDAVPFYIVVKYTQASYDSLRNQILENNQKGFYYSESCNLILYRFQKKASIDSPIGSERLYENWLNDHGHCSFNAPIPNMPTIDYDNGDYFKDAKVYVERSMPGEHFPNLQSQKLFFPEEWDHGFSSGYLIVEDQRSVYYWCTVW